MRIKEIENCTFEKIDDNTFKMTYGNKTKIINEKQLLKICWKWVKKKQKLLTNE